MATTLANLIRSIAQNSSDWIGGAATVNTGNTQVIQDDLAFVEDNSYFRGCEIYFTSGANIGLTRRIDDSSRSTRQITVVPNLVAPVGVGDQYDITNFRGIGHRRSEYKGVINSLIRQLGDGSLYQVSVPISPNTVTWNTPIIAIPAGITHVCHVEYLDSGRWKRVPRTTRPDSSRGFFIQGGASPTISFDPYWADSLVGSTVRLQGWNRYTELVLDSDTTDVDEEWLIEEASGILQIGMMGNQGNIGPGQYMRNRGDAVRGKAMTIIGPGCVKVR